MSLADFMQEPVKNVVTPVKVAPKTWGTSVESTAPATSAASGNPAARGGPSTPQKTDFSKIQAEEELLRKSSQTSILKGNVIPWLIERRPRAESLDVVMQMQQIEQMEAVTTSRVPMKPDTSSAESNKKKQKNGKK